MKYTVKSPLLDSHTSSLFHLPASRFLFLLIIPAFILGTVFGYISGSRDAEATIYTAGYDAAMNHVRTTIEAKTPELNPFYMYDLGIKFIPRSNNIVGIKYIGEKREAYLVSRISKRFTNDASRGAN